MIRSSTLALCALLLCSGCHLFRKKPPPDRAKPSSHVATEVEVEFRQRWMDKRVGELTGQGMTQDAARAQALAEFRAKYSATKAAQMP